MDNILRRLRRLAQEDPTHIPQYIAALERAVGGLNPVDHPYLNDAKIAQCFFKDDRVAEQEVANDLERLHPARIADVHGNTQGFLINVYWEDDIDYSDDPNNEIAAIEASLSETTQQLLADASNLGYSQIVFWK